MKLHQVPFVPRSCPAVACIEEDIGAAAVEGVPKEVRQD
jgi:hypothetical protein